MTIKYTSEDPNLKDTISWGDFKKWIELQGIKEADPIEYICFRAFLREGNNNIKPKVIRQNNGTVRIGE